MNYFKKLCVWLGITAIVIFGSIVSWPYLNYNNSEYWHQKGSRLEQQESYEEALKAYTHLTNLDSTDVVAWNSKADILYRLKRYNEASESYDRVLTIEPNNHHVALLKAQSLGFADKPIKALSVYDRLLSIGASNPTKTNSHNNPPTFEILLLEGRAHQLLRLQQYQEALNTYDYAIRKTPLDIHLWNARTVPLLALKQYEKVVETTEVILQMNPDSINAAITWNSKGAALFELHRYEEARGAFKLGIQFNPKYGILWYNLARLHMLKGYEDSVITHLKTAFELDPTLKGNITQDSIWHALKDTTLF